MTDEARYVPIDCSLHDHLEARATLGESCRIRYRDPNGDSRTVTDRIVDVFAKDGQEFMKTGAGLVIRLDRLESVDGLRFDLASGPGGGEGDREPEPEIPDDTQ